MTVLITNGYLKIFDLLFICKSLVWRRAHIFRKIFTGIHYRYFKSQNEADKYLALLADVITIA